MLPVAALFPAWRRMRLNHVQREASRKKLAQRQLARRHPGATINDDGSITIPLERIDYGYYRDEPDFYDYGGGFTVSYPDHHRKPDGPSNETCVDEKQTERDFLEGLYAPSATPGDFGPLRSQEPPIIYDPSRWTGRS